MLLSDHCSCLCLWSSPCPIFNVTQGRTKYFMERVGVLQRKVNFLLVDENRSYRKVVQIRGTTVHVQWYGKNYTHRARWSLEGTVGSVDGTTAPIGHETNNALGGSVRKKFPKGKPSFNVYSDEPTDAAVAVDQQIATQKMLKQMYSADATAAVPTSSKQTHKVTAPTTSKAVQAPYTAPHKNLPPLTAQELENMCGEFASYFAGDVLSATSAPSASAAASGSQLPMGSIASAGVSAKPLDYSVLQTVANGNRSAVVAPTANSKANAAPATSSNAATSAGKSSSAVVDLTEAGHAESPLKKQRLEAPAEPAVATASPVRSGGYATQSPLCSSPRLVSSAPHSSSKFHSTTIAVESVPIASEISSAQGLSTSTSTSSATSSSSHTSANTTTTKHEASTARPQPWHTAADGPLRERNVQTMLRRIRGTQESNGTLPSWVELRRDGCRKVENKLYYECTTRGEYMYKVLK